jgi:hypothetical protein
VGMTEKGVRDQGKGVSSFFQVPAIPERAFQAELPHRLRHPFLRGSEQPGTEGRAVQGMIDHTAHVHSPRSAHNPTLSPFPQR